MPLCTCPSDALCDTCVDQRYKQLCGVAASRGETWAGELRGKAAPVEGDRELLLELARRRIADVTTDRRLGARLAEDVVWWAVPALRRGPWR